MERFVAGSVLARLMARRNRLWRAGAAVDDARRAARAAQPAARAATLDASRKGGEFVMHRATPLSAAFRSFSPQGPPVVRGGDPSRHVPRAGKSIELYVKTVPCRNR